MVEFVEGQSTFAAREFQMGRALTKSFGIFFRYAIPFTLISIVIWAPIYALQYYYSGYSANVLLRTSRFNNAQTLSDPRPYISLLLQMVLSIFYTSFVINSTMQILRGRGFKLGLGHTLSRFMPVLGLYILVLLSLFLSGVAVGIPIGISNAVMRQPLSPFVGIPIGVGYGIVLILFYVRWYLAIPVCVMERVGPLTAMKRSVALTKGSRWKIFGFLLLFSITTIIIFAVLMGLVNVNLARNSFNNLRAMVLLVAIVSILVSVFMTVAHTVIYRDIRTAKEGTEIEAVVAIFD